MTTWNPLNPLGAMKIRNKEGEAVLRAMKIRAIGQVALRNIEPSDRSNATGLATTAIIEMLQECETLLNELQDN